MMITVIINIMMTAIIIIIIADHFYFCFYSLRIFFPVFFYLFFSSFFPVYFLILSYLIEFSYILFSSYLFSLVFLLHTKGTYFSDLALVDDEPCHLTLTATTDTECFSLTRCVFEEIIGFKKQEYIQKAYSG